MAGYRPVRGPPRRQRKQLADVERLERPSRLPDERGCRRVAEPADVTLQALGQVFREIDATCRVTASEKAAAVQPVHLFQVPH